MHERHGDHLELAPKLLTFSEEFHIPPQRRIIHEVLLLRSFDFLCPFFKVETGSVE